MVQQPVEDRTGDHGVAEDLAPRAQTLVAGQQDLPAMVAPTDEVVEEIRAQPINRDVADLADGCVFR